MNSLNMHLEEHENPLSIEGEIAKSGSACWLKFKAGGTDVAVFFDNSIQLAVFCREHNFPLLDNRVVEEGGECES